MMKCKRVIIGCILMLYVLSGCRLAREDMGASKYEDRFVGFFITYEHLDLFDIESFLNDNIKGGDFNITVGGNTEKYQGRLYAQLVKGESYELDEYKFTDIEGISFFTATIQGSDGNGPCIATTTDAGIDDIKTHVTTGDEENSTVLTGTLYISPRSGMNTCYFNPVYQSKDGSIYLTAGSGLSAGGVQDEGSVMSTTMDSEITITEDGKAKTEKVSVTVSVSMMIPPSSIAILQMDENSSLITRTEYTTDALPESIDIEPETSYLIVEQYKQKYDGSQKIAREVYGKDDSTMGIFSATDNGVCTKNWIQINWQ